MTGLDRAPSLIVSFPAAGAGADTFSWLDNYVARTHSSHLAMANAATVGSLASGQWREQALDEIHRTAAHTVSDDIVLVGHSMGGLSALCLSGALATRTAMPVRVLLVNTPCPDAEGRIPTMSTSTDSQIATILADDGFPAELLSDEEILSEVAARLRSDAQVADQLAVSVNTMDNIEILHVFATHDDTFIGKERCAAWRDRISDEFHLIMGQGGHMLGDTPVDTLVRAVDMVITSAKGS